jgi:hypothetical protein
LPPGGRAGNRTTACWRLAPLGAPNYQVTLDATASSLSGSVASGGIEAMLPTGTELYSSAQLTGTNLFAEGDRSIAGVRMADLEACNLYVLALSALSAEQRTAPQPALKKPCA